MGIGCPYKLGYIEGRSLVLVKLQVRTDKVRMRVSFNNSNNLSALGFGKVMVRLWISSWINQGYFSLT